MTKASPSDSTPEKPAEEPTQTPSAEGPEAYDASRIKVLAGMDAVRKRPAMYIGDTTSRGLHHLVYEAVDNSIDEAMAGHCTQIDVTVHADNSVSVADDGRGIPIDKHAETGRMALELIMTTLHAGGKFDRSSYKVSGGLHGVGVSVVNALSEWLEVEVRRDGGVYQQRFARGVVSSELQRIGKTKRTGSVVTFLPDREIFTEVQFSFDTLAARLRELAFLNRGVAITLKEEAGDREERFEYAGGIVAFVMHLNETKDPLHKDVVYIMAEQGGVAVELALQYNDTYAERVFSYANNINTIEGGTHLSGFRSALTRTLNAYGRGANLIKDNAIAPVGDDFREGLTAIINVRIPEPQFEGQTKTKLGNSEVEGIVQSVINDKLSTYLEEHPPTAKRIVQKGLRAAEARVAARKARDLTRRRSVLSSGGLPGKLWDCSSRDVQSTELFLVEGDSAAGSAKGGRDGKYQAILPLRGKILNVEKARIDRMLANEEICTIITSVGTGIGEQEYNDSKRRYGKIILMADADVDGSHIRTLILTFLYRQMCQLVEAGCIYIAQPPLYHVKRKKFSQYVHSDAEMDAVLTELGLEGTTLASAVEGPTLDNSQVRQLVELVQKLLSQTRLLARRSITLDRFLSLRETDTGRFPRYRVRVNGHRMYAYSDEQYKQLLQEESERRGGEIDDESVDIIEIHEAPDFRKCIEQIERLGFSTEHLLAGGHTHANPMFHLVSDSQREAVVCLAEVPEAVRRMGQQGLEITRYKGLGEMDAVELWETTMDPARRVLLRVRLEDVAKADEMFSILMGDAVAPRREFIEKHALEVRNLDI